MEGVVYFTFMKGNVDRMGRMNSDDIDTAPPPTKHNKRTKSIFKHRVLTEQSHYFLPKYVNSKPTNNNHTSGTYRIYIKYSCNRKEPVHNLGDHHMIKDKSI